MSGKWTPGPWHCHRNPDFWEFGSDERGQLEDVCASAFSTEGWAPVNAEEVMEANARLIAQSPAMADVLEAMVERFGHDIFTMPPEDRDLLTRAVSVLAKAKGEGA